MGAAQPEGNAWPEGDAISPVANWLPTTFHAYVHVPFCSIRCGYCDFNTYLSSELRGSKRETYHDSVLREIEFSQAVLERSGIEAKPLSSIFLGGGTPTLLSAEQIRSILTSLTDVFGVIPGAEFTVEANPDTVDEFYVAELVAAGVNRISFGVQSFDQTVLATLDRTHRPESVPTVVRAAKSAGLKVSVDLIYGTPGESLESWTQTLKTALALGTDHISAYSLIVESGTKLASKVKRGLLPDIDSDFHADCYEVAAQMFAEAGLDWYEVSNWARGAENQSVHNKAYWQSKDWWGYGPGAHSHIAGNRWWNVKHPANYEKLLIESGSPAAGHELVGARQALEERLLLELRTVDGVSLYVLRELQVSQRLVAEELANGTLRLLPDGRISVTEVGRLTADAIVLRLLTTQ